MYRNSSMVRKGVIKKSAEMKELTVGRNGTEKLDCMKKMMK